MTYGMTRTRIKICGITSPEDAHLAVAAGADAIGLVFFAPSPRNVAIARALEIARGVPPLVSRVALFVNPEPQFVRSVLAAVPIELLQFHGDEPAAFCRSFARPYLKVVRVRPGLDLVKYLADYDDAQGWLLDTYRSDRYGGTGDRFDWAAIPATLTGPDARPLVLSGGLDPANAAHAVRAVRPWAVDVSSGVERAPGIKDAVKVREFVAAVRKGDGDADE